MLLRRHLFHILAHNAVVIPKLIRYLIGLGFNLMVFLYKGLF
jgi:hypothetical protein